MKQQTPQKPVPNPQKEVQTRMQRLNQWVVSSFVFVVLVAIFLKIVFF